MTARRTRSPSCRAACGRCARSPRSPASAPGRACHGKRWRRPGRYPGPPGTVLVACGAAVLHHASVPRTAWHLSTIAAAAQARPGRDGAARAVAGHSGHQVQREETILVMTSGSRQGRAGRVHRAWQHGRADDPAAGRRRDRSHRLRPAGGAGRGGRRGRGGLARRGVRGSRRRAALAARQPGGRSGGARREAGCSTVARPGQVIIDLSTSAPSSTQRIAAALAERGVGYLDAGISGGAAAAEKGTLTIMVGGPAAVLESVRWVFAPIAAKVVLMGGSGAGHTHQAAEQLPERGQPGRHRRGDGRGPEGRASTWPRSSTSSTPQAGSASPALTGSRTSSGATTWKAA